MAIYHLTTHTHSRGKGHSAVSAAAYRSGEKLYDERLGETYNWQAYRKSHGEVMDSQIFLPANADKKYLDRGTLWNSAESSEKTKAGEYKKTAAIAREIEASLPHEMNDREREILAKKHAEFLVNRYGTAVDMNIHAPHPQGSDKNYHVHFLMTTRKLEAEGFTEKTELEVDGKTKQKMSYANGKHQIIEMRKNWENDVNREMQRGHYSERIDHRSYEEQGIKKIPTQHMGVTATAMERKSQETDRGNQNRFVESKNCELSELLWQESIINAAIEKEQQYANEINNASRSNQSFSKELDNHRKYETLQAVNEESTIKESFEKVSISNDNQSLGKEHDQEIDYRGFER